MTEMERQYRPDSGTIPATGEVEVARLVYPQPRRTDTVSVLAGRQGRGLVYRVVTDNGDVAAVREPCRRPLTTGQLIHLIHRAGHAGAYWYSLLGRGVKRADLPPYQAFSGDYPALRSYFADRCRAFHTRRPLDRGTRCSPQRVAAARRMLLDWIAADDNAKGVRRTDAERAVAAERFLSFRFEIRS